MTKIELRKKYKLLRCQIAPDELEQMSIGIANTVLKMNIWQHSYYHIFLPIVIQREINTEHILRVFFGKDKEIVVSKSDFISLKMTHYLLAGDTQILVNRFGVPEPADGLKIATSKIDVVFVPLLAYDLHGNRVGYGQGFYDQFLSDCRPDVLKIGLSFFEPEPLIDGILTTDVKLDFCINPNGMVAF